MGNAHFWLRSEVKGSGNLSFVTDVAPHPRAFSEGILENVAFNIAGVGGLGGLPETPPTLPHPQVLSEPRLSPSGESKGRHSPPHRKTRQAETFIYSKGKGGIQRKGFREASNGKAQLSTQLS